MRKSFRSISLLFLCCSLLLLLSSLSSVNCEPNDDDEGRDIFGKAKDKAKELANSTKEAAGSVAEKVKDAANSTKQSVSSSVESVKDAATAAKSILSSEDNSSVCYSDYDLGCFTNAGVWHTASRPFPLPQTPDDIQVKLYLHTRENTDERYTVKLRPEIFLADSHFDSRRPYTCFITHGFGNDGNSSWLANLTDAYLKQRDANIFIVDWGKGASSINYLQVAANTRVVAAELTRFVKYLIEEYQLSESTVHLLGHSLGAQILALVGKAIGNIRQLTAFDPAQPGFEGEAGEVCLVKGDAEFVEIIHTNGRPFVPYVGFGYVNASGNVDYYVNGGQKQPGCSPTTDQEGKITGISDLTAGLSKWTTCGHSKSYEYYIEALAYDNCTFWGIPIDSNSTLEDDAILNNERSIIQRAKCTSKSCSPVGLKDIDDDNDHHPVEGNFIVFTNPEKPYCVDENKIAEIIKKLRDERNGTNNATSHRYQEKLHLTWRLLIIAVAYALQRYHLL